MQIAAYTCIACVLKLTTAPEVMTSYETTTSVLEFIGNAVIVWVTIACGL